MRTQFRTDNLTVLFRCDASPRIGLGHLTRCTALARALKKLGIRSVFAMKSIPGYLGQSAFKRCPFIKLQKSSPDSVEERLSLKEVHALVKFSQLLNARVVLIDHYGASTAYLQVLRDSGLGVAVIDDVADRDLRAVDWILNQNLSATQVRYRTRPGCAKLLGPKYALLRSEILREGGKHNRRFSAADNRILVTLGGGDYRPLMIRVLKALRHLPRRLEIHAILNASQQATRKLQNQFKAFPHRIRWLPYTNQIAKHMVWADVSICAAGSTIFELLCLGVPVVSLCVSDNQRSNAIGIQEKACGKVLDLNALDQLAGTLESLLRNAAERSRMSARQVKLIDGRGAERVARSLAQFLKHRLS